MTDTRCGGRDGKGHLVDARGGQEHDDVGQHHLPVTRACLACSARARRREAACWARGGRQSTRARILLKDARAGAGVTAKLASSRARGKVREGLCTCRSST